MSRKKPKRTVPRRVRTITEEELPPEIDNEPAIDDDLLELESFFQQLGDENIRYKLYRVEKGGKRVWLEDGTPETFSEACIQQAHGEGDYLIRAISGRNWIKSKQISIGAARSGQHQADGSSEQVRALELRLREIELQAQQAREAEMSRQHELTLKLIETIGGREMGHSGPTLDELISGVRNLRDLSGNNGGTLGSIKEALEVVEQMNALRGDHGKEDESLLSALKPVVPELTKVLLPLFIGGRAVNTQPGSVAPGSLSTATTTLSETTQPDVTVALGLTDEQFGMAKRQLIGYAIGLADAGRSPELYADMAIETCDVQRDPVSGRMITEIVNTADFATWFAALEKLEPAIVTRRPWFEDFFKAVRDVIAGQNRQHETKDF